MGSAPCPFGFSQEYHAKRDPACGRTPKQVPDTHRFSIGEPFKAIRKLFHEDLLPVARSVGTRWTHWTPDATRCRARHLLLSPVRFGERRLKPPHVALQVFPQVAWVLRFSCLILGAGCFSGFLRVEMDLLRFSKVGVLGRFEVFAWIF